MTPTYKRNAGILFMALGAGQLLYAVATGHMEGVDSLFNLITRQYSVPPTWSDKPLVFLLGLAANLAFLGYGIKLFLEARKAAA